MSETGQLADTLIPLGNHFRELGDIKRCVHSYLAALAELQSTPGKSRDVARLHLQLGSVLYEHTHNLEHAKNHLQNAVSLTSRELGPCDWWGKSPRSVQYSWAIIHLCRSHSLNPLHCSETSQISSTHLHCTEALILTY